MKPSVSTKYASGWNGSVHDRVYYGRLLDERRFWVCSERRKSGDDLIRAWVRGYDDARRAAQ